MMEPILRGLVKYLDDGRMVWEGRWGMTPSAFEEENQAEELNSFRYVCNSHVQLAAGDVVSFRGHFEVASVNKGSKSQFTDKELQIEVTGSSTDDSEVRIIQGKGSNRFGAFTLTGTFNPSSKQLEVKRLYAPRPVAPPSVSSSKKRALSEIPAGSTASPPAMVVAGNASVHSTPPSSPSSPTDVAAGTALNSARKPLVSQTSTPKVELPLLTEIKSILKELKHQDSNKWFTQPVDAEALGLRDYHSVVKTPMDLGTIQSKLDAKEYSTIEQCFADMRLTFENALMYNPRGSPVYRAAADLNVVLEDRLKKLAAQTLSRSTRTAAKTPVAIPVFEASSMGKRNRITKKFFEPGDDHNTGLLVTISNSESSKQKKKAVSSNQNRAGRSSSTKRPRMSETSQPKSLPTSVQPTKKRTTNRQARATSMTDMSLAPFMDTAFDVPHTYDDEDEGAESFDELDLNKPGDELFMTPPPSDDEGDNDRLEGGEDDDDIPLSAIPLGLSSTPEFSRLANFSAMSPTNMLEDVF